MGLNTSNAFSLFALIKRLNRDIPIRGPIASREAGGPETSLHSMTASGVGWF